MADIRISGNESFEAALRRFNKKVQQAGIAFQTGYLWRYDEGAQRLKAMIAEGRFGKLISVEMTCVTSDANRRGPSHFLFDPQQSGGGYFNWLGCHYLDLLGGHRSSSIHRPC